MNARQKILMKDDKLKLIKNVVLKHFQGARVILFGSRTTENFNELSDYDLMVVVDYNIKREEILLIKSKIRRELATYNIPIDIVITNENEFKKTKSLTNHIFNEALINGIAL